MKQNNYNTKQKTAIMRYVKSMKDKHFTVDSICETMSKNGEMVGRTTVYRFLEKLSSEQVLRKYAASSGESVCYQYVDDSHSCHEHFHLKCEKCGSLIHMECDELSDVATHIKEHHGFSLNPLKTVIYGVCEGCSEK